MRWLTVRPRAPPNTHLTTRSSKKSGKVFTTCPEDRPLIAQFCGNDPETVRAG